MREMYQLPQRAISNIMQGMTKLCEDSVRIAEEKVRRRLADTVPEHCDLSDCFDMTDDHLFRGCGSDWLRNQFFKKHFHVVVCTFSNNFVCENEQLDHFVYVTWLLCAGLVRHQNENDLWMPSRRVVPDMTCTLRRVL